MSTQDRIRREVEETLLCFDRKEILTARPDFYSRVQARIRSADTARRHGLAPFFRRRVLVPAALIALIALNIISTIYALRPSNSERTGRQQEMIALAEEYDINPTAVSSYWR